MADIRNQADTLNDGEFVISEANGQLSREKYSIVSGEASLLKVGHVAELSGGNVERVATAGNAMGVVRSLDGSESKSAVATLTMGTIAGDGDVVVVGGKTYTYQTTLTNVDGNVLIGASIDTALDNLASAIVLGVGAGTEYAAAMTVNANVRAYPSTGDTMVAEALTPGSAGNTIVCTTDITGTSWSAGTLLGGEGVVPSVAVVMTRNCEVVADDLNYNGLVVATVDTALAALGIIKRARPTKQTTQTT